MGWGRSRMTISETLFTAADAVLSVSTLRHRALGIKGSQAAAIGWHENISRKKQAA